MKKILLFVLMLVLGSFSFAENVVITSIQPLYSLTSYLTKGTDIKVYTPFGSDVSMTMSKDSIREESFNLSIANKAQAVVDIAKVWPEDVIYGKARMNKINIVEIDASHPYDEKMTTIFFSDYSNGKVNPYIWTGSKNLVRMVNIIARDLIRLYPNNKAKIETKVSKGCYIRSLIYDIGQDLGTYATMTALQRKQVGDYSLENSYSLEQIEKMVLNNDFKFLKTIEEIFSYGKYSLQTEKELTLYKNGNTVKTKENLENKKYRIYFQDEFIGLANVENNNLLKGYKYY